MEKMIAYCGINCAECHIYLATQKDDDNLRKQAINIYELEKFDLKLKDINCTGCKSAGLKYFGCQKCKIRECAEEKKYKNCAYCEHYVCSILNGLYDQLHSFPPESNAKKTLDEIRKQIMKKK